jgi:tRNA pseudouridine13 synthase
MTQYLTADIPGIGGVIKESPEDFRVEEIPLYLPCGEGEHVYFTFEKRGLTTLDALRKISRELQMPDREMGYAGMKDARAVTVQTVSIPRIDPQRLLELEIPGIKPLAAVRHRNKLRLGHLAGNRFCITVREVAAGALGTARQALSILEQRGVPNRFGEQRYGLQGNSHLIGRELIRQDYAAAVSALMGDSTAVTDGGWREAVAAFQRGDYAEALQLFPPFCRTEREVLKRLVSRPDDFKGAFRAVQPRMVNLYLSAFQSFLFDQIVEARLPYLDRIETGDLAWKHANGACFLVEDEAVEGPRAEFFEISPSGPMFGCKVKLAEGRPGEVEQAILARQGLTLKSFDLPGVLRLEGERRPLRVPLGDPHAEAVDTTLIFRFSLPKGAYATSVLREILKHAP